MTHTTPKPWLTTTLPTTRYYSYLFPRLLIVWKCVLGHVCLKSYSFSSAIAGWHPHSYKYLIYSFTYRVVKGREFHIKNTERPNTQAQETYLRRPPPNTTLLHSKVPCALVLALPTFTLYLLVGLELALTVPLLLIQGYLSRHSLVCGPLRHIQA